jgi:hypothetical protein
MRSEEKRREEMNGVMSKKKMEVITDYPTTWLCSHVVLSRFFFFVLFCFVLFCFVLYCSLAASHIGYLIFTNPLRHSFFFLFFFCVSPWCSSPCGL